MKGESNQMSKAPSGNIKKVYIVEGCCDCPNEDFMKCDETGRVLTEYFKHGSPDFHPDCPLESYRPDISRENK